MKKTPIAAGLDKLWYGTENSLNDYLHVQAQIDARIAAGPVGDEEDEKPYLLSVDNGIATISIAGPMSNKQSWYDKYFKIASYPAIRESLIAAAQDPSVSQILLDINSGGGSVNGVSDTADLIRSINENVKPVTAYTDGSMCSAAYWLACSAGEVYASNVALVGSIGVISTHMEYSKQLKQDGVGVTVMRAGKYKALVNSVEPLSEAAKEQMQAMLDSAYEIFVQHVADARNQPYDYVDANMAQGREFFGEQALAAGLVDGIESFDALVSKLQAKSIDNSKGFFDNPRNLAQGTNNMKKKAFTQADINAAVAAGIDPATLQANSAPEVPVVAATPAAATPAVETPAVETPAVETPTAEAPAAAAGEGTVIEGQAPTPVATPTASTDTVVSFLQAQIKDKDAAVLATNIELNGLKQKLADIEASHEGLKQIVSKSVSVMAVAMGGSAIEASGMSAVAVLAEHQRLSEQFQSKFKAGGVAAVDAAEASKGTAVTVDPLQRARLAAVRPTAKAK